MAGLISRDALLNNSVIRASDLMQRNVISVAPESTIPDLHRLFVDEELHGAPVVGDDGIVQGVVSTLDL